MVRWPRGGYRLWEEKYGLATHWTTCPSLSEFWYFQERCTVVSLSDSSFSLWEGNRSHYNRVWNLVGTWGLRWEEPVKTSESESAVGTGGRLCWVPPSCFYRVPKCCISETNTHGTPSPCLAGLWNSFGPGHSRILALTLSRYSCSHYTRCKRFLSMLNTTALTHPSLYHQMDWWVMSSISNGTTSLLSFQGGPYLALSNFLPTHPLHSLATNPHRTILYVPRVAILSYQPCLRLFLRTCINKLCNGTTPIQIQSISHSTQFHTSSHW